MSAILKMFRRGQVAPVGESAPVARVATFGPWAEHGTGCRCTVCK